MKDTDYAFAVAKIRAIENTLLSSSDFDHLISAQDFDSAVRFLEDKGFLNGREQSEIHDILKEQMTGIWQLLTEISPDKTALEFLIVKNDYHNLKASLKALISGDNDADYFILPSTVAHDLIKAAVSTKNFHQLPPFLSGAAEKTYELLARTGDGQLADILLDAMALDMMKQRAKQSGNSYSMKLAELLSVTANIKIAYRAAKTGKEDGFLQTALCGAETLDKTSLIFAAKKGADEFLQYLSGTCYVSAAEAMKLSSSTFEKWCDDLVMAHLGSAKYVSFGVDPLIAYYIAKETELKNIRIVLSCKKNGLSADIIKERVRMLYV